LLAIMNEIVARGDAFVYDQPFTEETFADYWRLYTTHYVAELDGKIVGAYVLRPNQPGRGSHIANGTYLVSSEARGHGVGRKLGEHSIIEAKRLGYAAMQFNAVVSTNTAAVKLWQSLGFEIIATLAKAFKQADGRVVDLFVMWRDL